MQPLLHISNILPFELTLAVFENFLHLASDPIVFRLAQILAIPFEVGGQEQDFPNFIDHQRLVNQAVAAAFPGVEGWHMNPHLPQPTGIPDQCTIFGIRRENFHHIGAAFA